MFSRVKTTSGAFPPGPDALPSKTTVSPLKTLLTRATPLDGRIIGGRGTGAAAAAAEGGGGGVAVAMVVVAVRGGGGGWWCGVVVFGLVWFGLVWFDWFYVVQTIIFVILFSTFFLGI